MNSNDLALIKMDAAVNTTGTNIRTIGLWPYTENDYPDFMSGQEVWLPGWGTTNANWLDSNSNALMLGSTKLMKMNDCKNVMSNLGYPVGDDVICGQVQSNGQDICTGDSG